MIKQILSFIFHPQTVYAHCDVPCGIYDVHAAQLAAKTVKTMTSKMLDLKSSGHEIGDIEYQNSLTRMISTKEEHAQICKDQILILWSDYFKPENITNFVDFHDKFWKAAKLCSKAKQTVSLQTADELIVAVEVIAQMFTQAEAAKK